MNQKPIAMVLLTVALSVMMSLVVSADVEKLLQPGEVQTVYGSGIKGSPQKGAVPQGSVSYALRYQERFLPKDLRDYEYVSYGNLDIYGKKTSVGRTIRGSPGISFGFPPSVVRLAPRLGVVQHLEDTGVQAERRSIRKLPLQQTRLTEDREATTEICCNKRILNIWNVEAWHLGQCDLMKFKNTAGEVESNRVIKSACGSHPGYRFGPCMTTNDILCTVPSDLP